MRGTGTGYFEYSDMVFNPEVFGIGDGGMQLDLIEDVDLPTGACWQKGNEAQCAKVYMDLVCAAIRANMLQRASGGSTLPIGPSRIRQATQVTS